MKYYVVIDTNVLVSAVLKSHSVPGSIVELAFDGPIIPILNEAMNLHPHAVLNRVLWRWYQSPSGFKSLRVF